jgi:hypothetical protein
MRKVSPQLPAAARLFRGVGITVVIGYKQNEGKNGFCSRTPKSEEKQM